MMKIALGLITALLLSACASMDVAPAPKVADSGVGHPSGSYPGPRAY
jgi:hypothetical protein